MDNGKQSVQNHHVTITGYYPGVIGEIVKLHGAYYHEHWDLDKTFEVEVARELSDFMCRFDGNRDGFWAATGNDGFLGSISLDARDDRDEGVRLRWFIVRTEAQGLGVGTRLMQTALSHAANKGYGRVYLWTFEGLLSARNMYDRFGFEVIHQERVVEWGRELLQQKMELKR
ncbi:MAG: GNAT family N-acetyltransferase [Deltaproteobacteria bacterium]|nr:GNAT family N-acetyltransferase [Candidatus Zymogenaceae bacterium]